MTARICRICNNALNNKLFVAREMMFGFRDEFAYIECGGCGCLQIAEIPENITQYYPENYYSYQSKGEAHYIRKTLLKRAKRILKKRTLDFYLRHGGLVANALFGKFSDYYPWLKKGALLSRSRILDIGCGSGDLLLRMFNDGFSNLTGVDPFIAGDINYSCGVTIHKKRIDELTDKYDLVMMHHAFEHMDEPLTVLRNIYNLLAPNGQLLIRVPVAGSYAWRTYGVNWVQLDAPRHFFLHTENSIGLLAKKAGFRVSDVVYDSYDLQFIGSEKYQNGLALVDADVQLSEGEKEAFREKAAHLNRCKDGDSACFYLELSHE